MAKQLTVIARDQCIGCFSCMYACSRTWHGALTTAKAALRVRAYAGSDGTFSIRTCQACAEPSCVEACPTGALVQQANGALKLDEAKCTSCRKCEEACLIGGLQWDSETKLPLPCLQCGECVRYCPNQVLQMVNREVPHVNQST